MGKRHGLIVLVMLLLLAACSKNVATSGPGSGSPSGSSTPTPTSSFPPYHVSIDPTKFSARVTNPYFKLTPGTTLIYEGTRDGAPIRAEMTVTKETKVIMGVRCVVVRDIVSGALDERTADWYAQDDKGNVWYFGEDTKEYTNGKVSSTAGTWEAGVDGALPGIVMQASPTPGAPYRQEYRPAVAEDVAKVLRIHDIVNVGAGNFSNVVVTEDTDLLDSTKLEHKFYGAGAGMIKIEGSVNGHHEVMTLKSILTAK
jgi:hypothetical protein